MEGGEKIHHYCKFLDRRFKMTLAIIYKEKNLLLQIMKVNQSQKQNDLKA